MLAQKNHQKRTTGVHRRPTARPCRVPAADDFTMMMMKPGAHGRIGGKEKSLTHMQQQRAVAAIYTHKSATS